MASSTLEKIRPTRVINAAGYHGKPNADWCEDHKDTVIRSNVMGAINVIDCCYLRGIHITHFGSACIYEANEQFPLDGPGFTELDPPNFGGSFYSHSKITSENVSQCYHHRNNGLRSWRLSEAIPMRLFFGYEILSPAIFMKGILLQRFWGISGW